METGIFPKILKIGKATPVYTKGDPQLFDNYRPISILPIFQKIFEKIVYLRIYSFFALSFSRDICFCSGGIFVSITVGY